MVTKTKIGIPRGLLNHKFLSLWETFFEGLGLDTVTSPPTTRTILEDGVRHTVDEACLPVKVFSGHCLYLRDKVDLLFVPHMASVEKGSFVCCKFLGLPDVIKNCIPDIPRVITVDIDLNKKSWRRSMYELGWNFTKNPIKLESAYKKALNAQRESTSGQGKAQKNGELTIGLVAHSYNIYDGYVNMDIIGKLENLGATVVTPDMLPPELVQRKGRDFSKQVYWTYGREIVGTASYLAEGKADGIILLTSFGCGPDSLLCELVVRRLKGKIPIMHLIFDEETAEVGLMTRLETFVDMIVSNRSRSGDLSHTTMKDK